MTEDFMALLREGHRRAEETKRAVNSYIQETPRVSIVTGPVIRSSPLRLKTEIHEALADISQPLADSYSQVYLDLADPDRVSWAGTVHEVREVLSRMLRTLAPDKDVKAQPWFTPESGNEKPTQRQRAKFILKMRGAGSNESELVEKNLDLVDAKVEALVRSTYNRASVAAHGTKGRTEVVRILRYFEAFTHDLLDLP